MGVNLQVIKNAFFVSILFVLLFACDGCKSMIPEQRGIPLGTDRSVIVPVLTNNFGEVVCVRAAIEDSRLKSGGVNLRIAQCNGAALKVPVVLRMDEASAVRNKESLVGKVLDVVGYESVRASGVPSAMLEWQPPISVQGYAIVNTFVVCRIVEEIW